MKTTVVHDIEPQGFRPQAAGKVLGVSTATVKKLLRTGKLRSVLIGRARVIPRDALLELLERAA
jgi:excisionase family DNA binding protein